MAHPRWEMLNPRMTRDQLGFLPGFLDNDDPRSVRQQIDANYQHGGGWRPFPGFLMLKNHTLHYKGDPPTPPLAKCVLRDETVYFYEGAFIAVQQLDGSYEVARVD